MLRSAVAVALPALVLAYALAQTTVAQRAAMVGALRDGWSAASRQQPPAAPAVQARPVSVQASIGPDAVTIDADSRGQFETAILIGGRHLPALIDTGATYVALTYEDAASVGIHPVEADFKYAVHTANGTSRVAAAVLPSVRIGNVEARDVQAVVAAPGTLTGQSLVGMSFLKKLSGFEIQSGRLLLRQ